MDIRVTAKVDTSAWERDIEELRTRLNEATRRGVNDGLALIENETKRTLMLRSHPKGTKTPSRPGQPPAMISGHLARSVRSEPAVMVARGRWSGRVGPTTVYGRIQELGGLAGRHHRSRLPARPYLNPASGRMKARVRRQFIARWGEAIARG